MLAIRRVLNSCIQIDCDQSDLNESNKENSTVRSQHRASSTFIYLSISL